MHSPKHLHELISKQNLNTKHKQTWTRDAWVYFIVLRPIQARIRLEKGVTIHKDNIVPQSRIHQLLN